jgi:hypothetical protein
MQSGIAPTGLTGGCQCGAVRYRLDASPDNENICHCRMCQKAGGAPFMAFAGVPAAKLTWLKGAPKIFASSAIAERGFCETCGTPLTYRLVKRSRIAVTIGSLDEPARLPPKIQYGVESRLAWCDGLFALPEQRTEDWLKVDAAALGNRQHPDRET